MQVKAMNTFIIYFSAFVFACMFGFLAAKIKLRFAKVLLAFFPFIAFTLYLYVYLKVLGPSGEGAGVPMLPIIYVTLCLPFAIVSVLAFVYCKNRFVV